MSGAPGIKIGNVHLMAGVPHIAAQMLDALTGTLEGGAPLLSETIGCWVPESEVADLLREVEQAHSGVLDRLATRSSAKAAVGANFVIRSTDAGSAAELRRHACSEALAEAGYDFTPGGI